MAEEEEGEIDGHCGDGREVEGERGAASCAGDGDEGGEVT